MANLPGYTSSNVKTILDYVTRPMVSGTMEAADRLLYWDADTSKILYSSYGIESLLTSSSMYSNHFEDTANGWSLKGLIDWEASNPGATFIINAGDALDGNNNGGTLRLVSGAKTGTGTAGSIEMVCQFGNFTVDNCTEFAIDSSKVGFYDVTPVIKPSALTSTLTTISGDITPSTPDYVLAATNGGWGCGSQDEFETMASVIVNLQTRVDELETKLQSLGLLS